MKRSVAILLGLALLASADAVLARGGNRGGGHGGSAGHHQGGGSFAGVHAGHHGGRAGVHSGHHGGKPIVGVRPAPVIVGRPHIHRHPVVVSSTIVVAAPFFYYPPVYAAPVYPVPVYQEPSVYVEQASEVRYYCPDYRDYYPNVATCPSPWLEVLPGASGYPN